MPTTVTTDKRQCTHCKKFRDVDCLYADRWGKRPYCMDCYSLLNQADPSMSVKDVGDACMNLVRDGYLRIEMIGHGRKIVIGFDDPAEAQANRNEEPFESVRW